MSADLVEHSDWSPDFLFPHGWFHDQNDDPFDNDLHVLPVNDLRPHERQRSCWCRPAEDAEACWVVVHTSLDGREQHQNAAKPRH